MRINAMGSITLYLRPILPRRPPTLVIPPTLKPTPHITPRRRLLLYELHTDHLKSRPHPEPIGPRSPLPHARIPRATHRDGPHVFPRGRGGLLRVDGLHDTVDPG